MRRPKIDFDKQRKVLEAWLKPLGWSVSDNHENDNFCDAEKKEIKIFNRTNKERQFYCLLHECGHVMTFVNDYSVNYPKLFKHLNKDDDKRLDCAMSYNIEIIEEEYEAWRQGKLLAKNLNLTIDNIKYNKIKEECVKTYLDWYVEISNNKRFRRERKNAGVGKPDSE